MTLGFALMLEWCCGDPSSAWHPVALFGRWSSCIERCWYRQTRSAGIWSWFAAVAPVALVLWGTLAIAANASPWVSWLVGGVVVWSTLGWRSLFEHVAAVRDAQDLVSARERVAHIVGRDVESLDEPRVYAAALESLAENASDAVVAPLFWGVVAGPLGSAVYRMVNTLDAMWGHRSQRYVAYGAFAARLDDLASWIPARLTALLYFAVTRHMPNRAFLEQARDHPSPNAGWPESALAQALGVQLGGPVSRAGEFEARPWIGPAGATDASIASVTAGLAVTNRVLFVGGAVGWLIWR